MAQRDRVRRRQGETAAHPIQRLRVSSERFQRAGSCHQQSVEARVVRAQTDRLVHAVDRLLGLPRGGVGRAEVVIGLDEIRVQGDVSLALGDRLLRLSLQPEKVDVERMGPRVFEVYGEQRLHVLFRALKIALSVRALTPVHAIQQPHSAIAQRDRVRRRQSETAAHPIQRLRVSSERFQRAGSCHQQSVEARVVRAQTDRLVHAVDGLLRLSRVGVGRAEVVIGLDETRVQGGASLALGDRPLRLSLQPEKVDVEGVGVRIVGVDGEQSRYVFLRTPEIALSVGALTPLHAIQQADGANAQGERIVRVETQRLIAGFENLRPLCRVDGLRRGVAEFGGAKERQGLTAR